MKYTGKCLSVQILLTRECILLYEKNVKKTNRDGHQFHQYQQNEHKKTMILDVGNPGSVFG